MWKSCYYKFLGNPKSPNRNVVTEGRRRPVKARSLHGTFIKKVDLKTFINDPLITVGGFVYGRTQASFRPGAPKESIAKMDSEGTLAQTVAEFQVEFDVSRNIIAWHRYGNNLSLSPISLKSFCYGYSAEYTIYVGDS